MAEYFHTCKLPHEVINEIQEIAQKEFATGLERKLFLREERIKIPEMRFFFSFSIFAPLPKNQDRGCSNQLFSKKKKLKVLNDATTAMVASEAKTRSRKLTSFLQLFRCRTRSGLRLLGVEQVSNAWTIRVDINAKGTLATVTAFKKSLQTTMEASMDSTQPPIASTFG